MLDEMDNQRFVNITTQAARDTREADGASNWGLRCVHKLVPEMTTATSAMLIGAGDRGENEQDC